VKVFRDAAQAGAWSPNGVAAIGKFDGIHLGHRRLVGRAVRRARAVSARCLVLTFHPYPQEVLGRRFSPLLSLEEKLRRLAAHGADGVVLLPFDRRMLCRTPAEFARGILSETLKVLEVFVGADFCVGRGRAGSVATLQALGRRIGFGVTKVPLLCVKGRKVSSTAIRELVAGGRLAEAEALLGGPLA
jgi:riboflavin kinase / FMN adenylyltransferase